MAMQLGVFGFVDHTHAAATELVQRCDSARWFGRSFSLRCRAPPHFVEEVFEEDHVVLRLLRFRCLDWH